MSWFGHQIVFGNRLDYFPEDTSTVCEEYQFGFDFAPSQVLNVNGKHLVLSRS